MSSITKPSKSTSSADPCSRPSLKTLLTWDDPVESAKVFAGSISLLLLYKYTDFVSWSFYVTTLVLAFAALAEYSGRLLTGEGFVTRFKPAQTTAIGDFLQAHAQILADAFKNLEIELQNLFTAVNIETTLKAALASYFLYLLTSLFSVWTILFVSTVLSFTVPPVYVSNKEVIDSSVSEYAELAKKKSAEAYGNLKSQAKPTLEKVQAQIAPVTDWVKSKLPVRTAGSTVKSTSVPVPPEATEVKATGVDGGISELKHTAAKVANAAEGETEPLLN
ncbi:DEKNAAC105319 [Brettanomyces naardenensis]|uniref:Reticulon-like protein n=1 Tax=Brettanomyces naardenensis TaxID=13370 RepID=A0A448YT76_BRENA|nr:DEKNAAC105319 [Brettanomyces naardenensis]